MKYQMLVPPPKASRMQKNCKVIITYHQGWEGDRKVEMPLDKAGMFQFDVTDGFEWIYASSTNDGDTFSVEVEYQNDKGTRKEIIRPVPEKVA